MLSVQPKGKQKGCAGCNRKIKDRYLLKALDKYWHEDCLKCACCDCRLGEVGSTLYTKANLILCRRDYLRWVLLLCPARTAPILLAWCNLAPSSKPGSLCVQLCDFFTALCQPCELPESRVMSSSLWTWPHNIYSGTSKVLDTKIIFPWVPAWLQPHPSPMGIQKGTSQRGLEEQMR